MTPAVPIAGLLASLGFYGVVIAAFALKKSKTKGNQENFREPAEWLGVLAISLFGMIGTAVTLAVAGGRPMVFVASTFIVGALGVAFFKMLEITPTPLFVFLIDTRHFGRRRLRRGGLSGLKRMWAESSIDGNVLQHQEDELSRHHHRNAFSGALTVATLIAAGNAYWIMELGDLVGVGSVMLAALALLWTGLVVVLVRAGKSMADRAPGIDWRRPF